MKRIILTGVLALLSIGFSIAETDDGKRRAPFKLFAASLPPDAGQAARRYELCVLKKALTKEFPTIDTLDNFNQRFSIACSKNIEIFRETLQRTEPDPERLYLLVSQLQRLVLDEVTVLPQDEPVPGKVIDPRVEKSMECLRTIDRETAAFTVCADKAMREIAPFSKEAANVVADAALGLCITQTNMHSSVNLACSFGNAGTMDAALDGFERKVRADILGKVVRFRVEIEKAPTCAALPAVICLRAPPPASGEKSPSYRARRGD